MTNGGPSVCLANIVSSLWPWTLFFGIQSLTPDPLREIPLILMEYPNLLFFHHNLISISSS
jgi:hypothetical protein